MFPEFCLAGTSGSSNRQPAGLTATLTSPSSGNEGDEKAQPTTIRHGHLSIQLPRVRQLTVHFLYRTLTPGSMILTQSHDGKQDSKQPIACSEEKDFLSRPIMACHLPIMTGAVELRWTESGLPSTK
jgi:hypothetical protein